MDTSPLDAGYRRVRIAAFLASRAPTTDVFCLQEVQESELPAFLDALGGEFTGVMAHNDPVKWLGRCRGRSPMLAGWRPVQAR